MQNNDPRLIKAAKRTIRAEVTLVLVIIVIASWSVYALYKLAFGGSDTLFGLSLKTKSTKSIDDGHQFGEPRAQEQKLLTNLSLAQLKNNNSNVLLNSKPNHPIYLASDAAIPIPQLNNIQSLIANQNPTNRNVIGNRGLNSPATISSLAVPSTTTYYDPRYIQHLTDFNGRNGQPNQLTTSAQLVAHPGVNTVYGRSNVPSVVPGGASGGRELDYESNSPDYGSPTGSGSDYSSDRQAEESNRDPGESVVENTSAPLIDEERVNSVPEATGAQDDSNEVAGGDENQQQTETTTSDPVSELDETSVDHDANQDQDPSAAADNSDHEQSQDTGGESAGEADEETTRAPEDEESARAAGLSIDEEVDRMTQPSLGSVSQHDTPINFNRDTVQFDDSPNIPMTMGTIKPRLRPVEAGTLVAQFADPRDRVGLKRQAKVDESDLQVDHDTVRVAPQVRSKEDSQLSSSDIIRALINRERRSRKRDDSATRKIKKLRGRESSNLNRQKRHLAKNIIRAPYEIDGFLNDLDIDKFIERPFDEQQVRIHYNKKPRALMLNERLSSVEKIPREGSLDAAPSEPVGERIGTTRARKKRKKLVPKNKLTRRSDEEEEEDEDDDDSGGVGESEERDGGVGDKSDQSEDRTDSSPARSHRSNTDPRYHYITSNDTTLQDLLTRQHLLDALRNSQLPSPTVSNGGGGSSQEQSNETGVVNSTSNTLASSNGGQHVTARVPAQVGTDHQQAGTLYSIDHGVMLYPASKDDYSSKSILKKKKKRKHEKKKEKKKMTVAVKKGGHKKKKHKKEEKKFIKEKKFKGAKKGKKVSKGKGGQGGKKGKKLYKDKGFKKKGFKNVYHKEEFGQKKSYFDEFRDKDFKKKWKKFDDKYNYAQMKKWQAKDIKGAKKMKDHGEKFKKYDKGKWKKKYHKQSKEHSESSKKNKKSDGF